MLVTFDKEYLKELYVSGKCSDKILENPQILKIPIVRNGRQATLGYQPDVWKTWE